MPRVSFKLITWYFEMHHVRALFSVWRHDFFVLRDVHSPYVYLQVESLQGVLRVKKNTANLSISNLISADKLRPFGHFYGRQKPR